MTTHTLVEVAQDGGLTVIRPRVRRLDASVAPAFKREVGALVAAGMRHFVVDLGDVRFLDSSGLGALVSILKSAGFQGQMSLCGVGGSVQNLFRLTRMDKVFVIDADLAAARRRLAG